MTASASASVSAIRSNIKKCDFVKKSHFYLHIWKIFIIFGRRLPLAAFPRMYGRVFIKMSKYLGTTAIAS